MCWGISGFRVFSGCLGCWDFGVFRGFCAFSGFSSCIIEDFHAFWGDSGGFWLLGYLDIWVLGFGLLWFWVCFTLLICGFGVWFL